MNDASRNDIDTMDLYAVAVYIERLMEARFNAWSGRGKTNHRFYDAIAERLGEARIHHSRLYADFVAAQGEEA